jgi:hypothetical protein
MVVEDNGVHAAFAQCSNLGDGTCTTVNGNEELRLVFPETTFNAVSGEPVTFIQPVREKVGDIGTGSAKNSG